jgi:hypothetical protein
MSANCEQLDQFEEENAAGGHAGEVEAIRRSAVSSSMTSRPFPSPWYADPIHIRRKLLPELETQTF